MADISYMQNEDLAHSSEAMENEDDEDVSNSRSSEEDEVCASPTSEERQERANSTSGSDEGGGGSETTEDGGGSGSENGEDSGGEVRKDQRCHLSRLKSHATSDSTYNRQMVGRILVDLFRVSVDTRQKLEIDDVMQSLYFIMEDEEAQVRIDLVDQLPHVAMICREAPHLFGDVCHHLLGIITKHLRDSDNQVRQTAQAALLLLIEERLIDNNVIEFEVCPVVEFLTYMPVEYLNSAISLMSKISPLIDSKLVEKAFLDRFISLCKNSTFHVRRICAVHFGEICTSVGRKALYQKLFPAFIDLCWDNVWSVRKACVDVMMPVSCCLTRKHRIMLSELLALRLNDDSKWVRVSAFQILGPFISTFAKEFIGLDHNQYDELVFTNCSGNSPTRRRGRFSIRYLHDGISPTKCSIRNQMIDTDDFEGKENVSTSVTMRKPIWNRTDMSSYYEDEDTDCQTSNLNPAKIDGNKGQDENAKSEETEDIDRYNPFLYYYISPDLPLDEELIQAAKKSVITDDTEKVSTNEEPPSETQEVKPSVKSELEPDERQNKSNNVDVNNTSDTCKACSNTDEKENNVDGDSSSFVYLRNTTEMLNDTIDVSNISLDKSAVGTNVFIKRENSDSEDDEQVIVPQVLIHHFVSMADPELCTDTGIEISHHCAFSFPAVVLTLGRENWHHLKKAYQALAIAKHWKVRRTLASSIHEIAKILGEELTTTDLVPIFNGFIKDLDEVRIGVLVHLTTFLNILKPAVRCQYLPRFNDFLATDEDSNWRFRDELATQLIKAVPIFSRRDVVQYIAPLSLQLLLDKVAAVRAGALLVVAEIFSSVSNYEAVVTGLIREIQESFANNSKKWVHRQTYALLCAELVSRRAIKGSVFSKEMLTCLLTLSWDKVPNVRLAVARTLSRSIVPMGAEWLGAEAAEKVNLRLKQMRLDQDRDVRELAGSVNEVHHVVCISRFIEGEARMRRLIEDY